MTKRIAGLSFVVGLLVLAAAAFAGTQDFVAVNKTGVEIHHMYVSPTAQDEWGDDILGEDVCPPNAQVSVTFSDSAKAEAWDLRIEDQDGNSIEWKNLKLNEISKLTLHYADGKAWADVE